MKKQRTIYHLIVDRSGSMSDCIEATINGYNEQLNRIRNMQSEFPDQDIRMGLTMFNTHIDMQAVAKDLKNAAPLTRKNYVPDGGTALYDAIGQSVLHLEESFARQSDIPATFVIVVLTDGYENSSNLFNLQQIRALIQRLEATEKWTFSFIGATLDAVEVAQTMAIKANNSYSFEKESMKAEVWDKLSDSMHLYFNKKTRGEKLSDLFDKE
ncbi:MAG: VWA domain-containing protein [Bacteroidetes bacterium]|nr:VWA domain-containing protein [Bacteroidota bacterium]